MILHTHFLLHLYLITIVLDYLSLINTKSRFERDKVGIIEKEDGRIYCLEKVEEEPQETSLRLPGLLAALDRLYHFRQLTVPCKGFSQRTVSSPSEHGKPLLAVLLQWLTCLTLSNENQVGFCNDSYCAYSDTEIKFKYSELHIDCQLSKRGVIYLFHSRRIHISSKGKLDTWVISTL